MTNEDGDSICLSSGRVVQANHGIIGISGDLQVYEGYDGFVDVAGDYLDDVSVDGADLTDADRVELADLMVARWMRYRQAHEG